MEVEVGQIWREVGSRNGRHIRIDEIHPSIRRGIEVRTVVYDPVSFAWTTARRSRQAYLDFERFNGKLGGYEYVESCKVSGSSGR